MYSFAWVVLWLFVPVTSLLWWVVTGHTLWGIDCSYLSMDPIRCALAIIIGIVGGIIINEVES